jgi:hypothetical protein
MTPAEIKQLVEATPFSPFRLHLADGRKLDVPHPDYIHVFNQAPRAVVEFEDGSWQLVNLPIVVSVEVVSESD